MKFPSSLLKANDREALEIAIVENVQRADLNALEEANGYALLAAEHGYSQSDIARAVGKSRSHIANTLRLMNLPEHTRELLSRGNLRRARQGITGGGRSEFIGGQNCCSGSRCAISNGSDQVLAGLLLVRRRSSNPDTRALEENLSLTLGAKVSIRHIGDSGEIESDFVALINSTTSADALRSPARSEGPPSPGPTNLGSRQNLTSIGLHSQRIFGRYLS